MRRSKDPDQEETIVIRKFDEGMSRAQVKAKISWIVNPKYRRTYNKKGQNVGWKEWNIQWIDSHKERTGRVRVIFITSLEVKLKVRK